MDGTTALLILVAALIVIALNVSVMRRERPRSLSPQLKTRPAQSWKAIQAGFVTEPAGAVREVDQLAVSIVRDSGVTEDGYVGG